MLLILSLLVALAPPATQPTAPPVPGADMVGRPLPTLEFDARPVPPAESPRAVLYRWWTDGCPFCEASLPALDAVRRRYADRGLDVVAIYHPKPPRDVDPAEAVRLAHERRFEGPVVTDLDWSELRTAWSSRVPLRATSISILVDAQRTVRHVHPGPVLFPSDDPRHAQENADYEALVEAIERVLGPADVNPSGRRPSATHTRTR